MRLILDQLLPMLKLKPVEVLLEDLPSGLEEMYTSLLREHYKRSRVSCELQILILQLVTHASHPLRLLDIAEVIRSTSIATLTNLQDAKNVIRSACGPLLTMLPDGTMQPIHHSFTEYLVNGGRHAIEAVEGYSPVLNSLHTHRILATICARCLTSCARNFKIQSDNDGNRRRTIDSKERNRLMLRYPFLLYATL